MHSEHEPLRLCTHGCDVQHYENCNTCFGFGLFNEPHPDAPVPISAEEAENIRLGKLTRNTQSCPECGGTIWGFSA